MLILNFFNILIALMVTILSGTWMHFIVFMMCFVPLRLCIGGYHAKKSENCFIMSTILYIVSVAFIKYLPNLYQSKYSIILVTFSVITILIFAPIEHKNNSLDKKSRRNNRILSVIFAILDYIIFALLCNINSNVASSIVIFIVIADMLMIGGLITNRIEVK